MLEVFLSGFTKAKVVKKRKKKILALLFDSCTYC